MNQIVVISAIATPFALVLREAIRVWFMYWCVKHEAKPETLNRLARLWRRSRPLLG